MYAVIWQFVVREGRETEFEHMYGPAGEWSDLFKQGDGYLGTELYREEGSARLYLTMDRWAFSGQYEAFKQLNQEAYEALDALGGELTEAETYLGAFLSR